jgi:glucose-6-phosphate 1-dehydrogenase
MKEEKLDKSPLQLELGRHICEPCILVIFGATGDLAKRKLIPAIYYLAKARLLPKKFLVIGYSRQNMNDDQFKNYVASTLEEHIAPADLNRDLMDEVARCFRFFNGDLTKSDSYKQLKMKLDHAHQENQTEGNCVFYFATAPSLFSLIADGLAEAGLTTEDQGWRRVIVEKPFGNDLTSAQALNKSLTRVLKETQIYRIDHYLGKETVQNILVFRFANGIFEPIWNRRYIDSVQITVAETLGVESRASYYDHAGALRDMVSSHLLQLLSLVAMEPPTSFGADDVRDEKVKVFKAIKPLMPEDVLRQAVRGQYDHGQINGSEVPSYRSEPGVAELSRIETYVALKLELDNWRWAGVPFYLRTGKRLPKRVTEIAIQFKCAPFELFRQERTQPIPSNFLVMHIQPDEGMTLNFTAKVPGPEIRFGNVQMNFEYADYFGHLPSTGYETLLYDCMKGDHTLFRRTDQVEYSWQTIMPILDVWSALPPHDFPNYVAGSWGPKAADELLNKDGRQWRRVSEVREGVTQLKESA